MNNNYFLLFEESALSFAIQVNDNIKNSTFFKDAFLNRKQLML